MKGRPLGGGADRPGAEGKVKGSSLNELKLVLARLKVTPLSHRKVGESQLLGRNLSHVWGAELSRSKFLGETRNFTRTQVLEKKVGGSNLKPENSSRVLSTVALKKGPRIVPNFQKRDFSVSMELKLGVATMQKPPAKRVISSVIKGGEADKGKEKKLEREIDKGLEKISEKGTERRKEKIKEKVTDRGKFIGKEAIKAKAREMAKSKVKEGTKEKAKELVKDKGKEKGGKVVLAVGAVSSFFDGQSALKPPNFSTLTHEVVTGIYSQENIEHLLSELRDYSPRANYLSSSPGFCWRTRATCVSWLSDLSGAFGYSSETFFYAVNYFDRFMAHGGGGPLACSAFTCLLLAAKMEEVAAPSLESLVRRVPQASAEEVRASEARILKALDFKLTPPTLAMWATLATALWDLNDPGQSDGPQVRGVLETRPFFRARAPAARSRTARLFELLQTAAMDVETLRFNSLAIVCACLYLILGLESKQFSERTAAERFPFSSTFLLAETAFNALISSFLRRSFDLSLDELLPSIQYMATFLLLPPLAPAPLSTESLTSSPASFEELLTRHVPGNKALDFVLRVRRRVL